MKSIVKMQIRCIVCRYWKPSGSVFYSDYGKGLTCKRCHERLKKYDELYGGDK
jgi:hypothetical protein